jgi:hypothetical protein
MRDYTGRMGRFGVLVLMMILAIHCGILCAAVHCETSANAASATQDCHHALAGSAPVDEDSEPSACNHPQMTAETTARAQLAVPAVAFVPVAVSIDPLEPVWMRADVMAAPQDSDPRLPFLSPLRI